MLCDKGSLPTQIDLMVGQALVDWEGTTHICIHLTPLLQEGCDTRSIFKWSTAGLDSVFFLLDWLPN